MQIRKLHRDSKEPCKKGKQCYFEELDWQSSHFGSLIGLVVLHTAVPPFSSFQNAAWCMTIEEPKFQMEGNWVTAPISRVLLSINIGLELINPFDPECMTGDLSAMIELMLICLTLQKPCIRTNYKTKRYKQSSPFPEPLKLLRLALHSSHWFTLFYYAED